VNKKTLLGNGIELLIERISGRWQDDSVRLNKAFRGARVIGIIIQLVTFWKFDMLNLTSQPVFFTEYC
jgi:hypothetical protein